ncbi:hypothetical protein [Nostoc sp. 'Lobaria pulmonaria (5183) cyanobiont']|uniref:hypothetical protein n=1 Tax=Nostoc sp. 'Lobaria pulmonaria (5183) cyanobiont' TaxID=1618022 RepID=UPI000CF33C4E|nr:hypothetical protein [Nostoc sp. 'Lobaria pulmonaria (5183) cyanobiont']
MQADTLRMKANALTMQADTLTMQANALTMQANTLTMQADTLTMQVDALTMQVDTLTMQVDTLDLLHKCKIRPHPPTPSPKIGRRGANFKVPLPTLGEGFRVRAFDSCHSSINKAADKWHCRV